MGREESRRSWKRSLKNLERVLKDFNVSTCLKEAEELEKLFSKFINLCEEDFNSNRLRLTDGAKDVQREFLKRYEIWFTATKLIVEPYSSFKPSEFIESYVRIKNLIRMKMYYSTRDSYLNEFIGYFDTQVNMLHTVIPIISLRETNYKKIITADLLNSELSQAEHLFKYDFYRAAGAIAGVILERHLKTLCEVHQIEFGKNDTIEPLATKIYTSKKISEFDLTLFKSIQYLAAIRNKCDHPKDEPKQHEVRELLDKVKKITSWNFKN